jgi:hypothetical protein
MRAKSLRRRELSRAHVVWVAFLTGHESLQGVKVPPLSRYVYESVRVRRILTGSNSSGASDENVAAATVLE